ncbi:putative membrane protein [Pedobacter metabolipauper]|uniref:Putative membrane protein n=2 Tax=Pedobacter metabolipauper TaxID=425513 RepID=A0A4R6T0F2_9SPHI|nr:putative membrane protein [Pedobacter metabolipauper]
MLIICVTIGTLTSKPVSAQVIETERILSFHSDIRIDATGMMQVSEKLHVSVTNDEIQRGITRTIPTFRKDIFGNRKPVNFKVTSVLKNGQTENYTLKDEGGSRTLYIGNENIIIPPGYYDYEINYETRGHVGFFDDYDEIYWNVTGSEWIFPIESASATVTMPKGAIPGNTACYTGPAGSKDHQCSIVKNPDQSVTFKTTASLGPGEGFTVAVAFTKGIIERPSLLETLFNDYLKVFIAVILALILMGYYYFSWSKYGRDPKKPVIIPSFNIPDNWSPALLRYFYKKKIDERSFAIVIINMAVKKVIRITKGIGKKEDYALERSTAPSSALAKEENAAYSKLLDKKNRIYVNNANGSAINSARKAHENSLKSQIDLKNFFISYKAPLVKSVIVTAVVLVLFMIFVERGTPLMMLFFSPFLTIGGYCFIGGIKTLKESVLLGLFLIVWGAGFAGGPIAILAIHLRDVPTISLTFLMVSTASFILYIYLIKAPTQAGSAMICKIEGFKMYLKTAEEHRLALLNPPELTPALFEKFLPYAIALDVENEWAEKFESVLNNIDYIPEWYEGDDFRYDRFSRSFITPFNQAVSDSKPTSSSNSDSGSSSGSSSWSSGSSSDSGSSGGGGGGGGGGGW